MDATKINLLRLRLDGFSSLATASTEGKKRHVTRQMATQFNDILRDIASECPVIAASLPQPITFQSDAARVAGLSDVTYLDLEIMVKQVNGLLATVAGPRVEARNDLQALNRLEHLLKRFHAVAKQLTVRHAHKDTLRIMDEYDVQDLLHALLRIDFDDIRKEEWTPSYAGGSGRMDFLLKYEEVVIEVKKTRDGLGSKEVGDQLSIDIARYKEHPNCKTLVCFVYDPDGKIGNPIGLQRDLERASTDRLKVVVCIYPQH